MDKQVGIDLTTADSNCLMDQEEELRLFTEDVLSTFTQQNDILSPTVHVLRDEIEDTYTVYPHQSDPPHRDKIPSDPHSHEDTLHYMSTDRPPDITDFVQTYGPSPTVENDQGVIASLQMQQYQYSLHHDSGANRSVTRHRSILHSISQITPLNIKGANKGSGFLSCTEKGLLNLLCNDGSIIPVPVYLTDDVEGTILSPTDICLHHYDKFSGWHQHSDVANNKGTLTFLAQDSERSASIDLYMDNGLWYSKQPASNRNINQTSPTIKTMTAEAEYELWHQRLCHPGQHVMASVHNAVDNVPNLQTKRHEFYHCDTCSHAKMHKANRNKTISTKTTSQGQRYHMDFGFVRGEQYNKLDKKTKRFVTSIDGYNSYLIIVDAHTRYTWVFLTSSKEPPIDIVKQFLNDHGLEKGPRYVRTDQGGELYKSQRFRDMAALCGYTVEPTGSDHSSQNGVAERPNRTYGNMMRAILSNANLDSRFWSYALKHSVFVKNRIPHSFHDLKMTPFEAYTGRRPDLGNLKIFGCPVRIRKPGVRSSKLANHTYTGRFLEYLGTNRNIRYFDTKTKRIKIASHVVYDEAQYSVKHKTPGALALFNAGLADDSRKARNKPTEKLQVQFKKLSEHATIPVIATDGSVGSDLFSAATKIIPPNSLVLFPTDLSLECPKGTYGRIAPRSGLTVKNKLTVMAGVIDNDYRGNVQVALFNFGTESQTISKGDKIAQIIFEQIRYPEFIVKEKLTTTNRGNSGFGSTDKPKVTQLQEALSHPIELCTNKNGPTIQIDLKIKGKHKTLGLIVDDKSYMNSVILKHCQKGTPSARIPKWRSTLREATIHSVNDTRILTAVDLEKAIQAAKSSNATSITIEFITKTPTTINPSKGVPSLYRDQLQYITDILRTTHSPSDITINTDGTTVISNKQEPLNFEHFDDALDDPSILIPQQNILEAIVHHVKSMDKSEKSIKKKKKLTRRYLKTLSNWNEWKKSENTQLELYAKQNMFKSPVACPPNANVLHLIWAYRIKDDGTLKARCVCNGNPKRKGTVTLDHTYAACLAQTGSRIFWALSAVQGLLVVGADASNAFAEAPAPKAPLYVYADEQYREWWMDKGNPEIPKNYVLPVNHALQGHPESPRLWSKLIDRIIRDHVGLQPTTHEPCLYSGEINGTPVYLLRQVDDFAVASKDVDISNTVISKISEKLSVPMHNLGIINRFNGVDISQTQEFIKVSNETYIAKLLENYEWSEKEKKNSNTPTPMKDDSAYLNRIDTEVGPNPQTHKKEYIQLENKMGFKYRKLLGELLFCMVTCRPDISFPIIKLAKFSNQPGEIHYLALKGVLRYLRATIKEGLHYWRKKTAFPDLLPLANQPTLSRIQHPHLDQNPNYVLGFTDADWAHDVQTRKSVTGIVMFFAGAAIYYKSKYQTTVAQSSTEAEFMSACDAGKISLYLRSILDELGLHQDLATILYEDNQGALLMGNAGMPTRRTRHMDIKYFSLQEWVEQDLIVLHDIESTSNVSDMFTKQLGKILFHKHNDTVMGRKFPKYYRGKYFETPDLHSNSDSLSSMNALRACGGCTVHVRT